VGTLAGDGPPASHAQIVQGAGDTLPALLHDMGVYHRGGHIGVAKQVLNGADIRPPLQQIGGKRMAEGMGADGLGQTSAAHRGLNRFIDDTGVHMMATGDAGAGVDGHVASWEGVLPAPCRCCLPIFPLQRMGQVDGPIALRQILQMQGFDPDEVVLEERDEHRGNRATPAA
jgi:hypothetical protein